MREDPVAAKKLRLFHYFTAILCRLFPQFFRLLLLLVFSYSRSPLHVYRSSVIMLVARECLKIKVKAS